MLFYLRLYLLDVTEHLDYVNPFATWKIIKPACFLIIYLQLCVWTYSLVTTHSPLLEFDELQCNFYKINYTLFWLYQVYMDIVVMGKYPSKRHFSCARKGQCEVHGYTCQAHLQYFKVLNWCLCIMHVALFLYVINVVVVFLCWGWLILCVLPWIQPPIPNISNVLKSLGGGCVMHFIVLKSKL